MWLFGAEFFVFQVLIKKIKIKVGRTVISLVVLYGCEIWSLTLRKKHRLRVFESRALDLRGTR